MSVSWALVFGAAAIAGVAANAAADDMPMLCPQPQEAKLLSGAKPLDLSRGASFKVASGVRKPVQLAVERLKLAVGKVANRQQVATAPAEIVVGCLEDLGKGQFRDAVPKDLIEQAAKLPAEGYLIRASGLSAFVVGKDVRGTVYGVETLIQLVRKGPEVPATEIRDFPDMAIRPTYCAGGNRLDDRIRSIVRLCVHYKLNMIVFENAEFYQLDNPEARKGLQEVFKYCEDMGIEPIPELQSFGWAQYVLPIDPLCVEAVPIGDRHFQFGKDDAAEPFYRETKDLTVLNAGLDQAEGNQIVGWEQEDVGTTIFSEVSERGGRCLKIKRDMPGVSRVSQRIKCEPDTCYELQVDMKTELGKNLYAYFEVYGVPTLDRKREFIHYPHVTGTTVWERRSLKFNTGPSREIVIYLRIQEGTGTAWFDNVTIKSARELPMVNVVETPDQPIVVTSMDKKTTYQRGADYEVEAGELRYPYPDDLKPWRLIRKKDGAIAPGQEILVSYEWAEPGDITYCPSEPRTQAIMKKALADTIKVFKPRYIHIGHDEPRVMNRDSRCRSRGMEAHELYVEDINKMYQYVKEADPGCRVMIWADAFRVNEEGAVRVAWYSEEKCLLKDAVKDMPRDIVMCPWRYTETDIDLLYRDLASLAEEGFDVTGAPWYDFKNAAAWGRAVERFRAKSEKCLAIFLTTWDDHWEALPLTADIMWTLSKPGIKGEGAELDRKLRERYDGFETYSR